MKKIFFPLVSILFSVSFLVLPPFTYAHFPQTDRNITVTLHVDPEDNPIPGQQAYIYFLFDDATKRFTLSNCNCIVSITEQGKQTYKQQLLEKKDTKPSIWGASLPYIFPNNDVYHIVLTGKPKFADAFQPFTLSWYFRVDPSESGLVIEPHSDTPMILGLVLGGTIVFILFGWFIKKQIIDSGA